MAIAITNKIKLDLSKIRNRSLKQKAREEVAEFLEDTILDYLSRGQSPVSGEKKAFVPLKKGNYRKIKAETAGSTKANMELNGDMLDDFETRIKGNIVTYGIHQNAGETSKLKAENHNKFTQRAQKSKTPKRRWIPFKEQKLRASIMKDITEIISDISEEES